MVEWFRTGFGLSEANRELVAGGSIFIPTHRGEGMPAPEMETAPVRSGSNLNPPYAPLTAESFADFEWIVFLDSTTYPRGAPSLGSWGAE